ncbi:hypothetical protein D3C72_1726650 [compost metagenome]
MPSSGAARASSFTVMRWKKANSCQSRALWRVRSLTVSTRSAAQPNRAAPAVSAAVSWSAARRATGWPLAVTSSPSSASTGKSRQRVSVRFSSQATTGVSPLRDSDSVLKAVPSCGRFYRAAARMASTRETGVPRPRGTSPTWVLVSKG